MRRQYSRTERVPGRRTSHQVIHTVIPTATATRIGQTRAASELEVA